jgi:hypothetical protein
MAVGTYTVLLVLQSCGTGEILELSRTLHTQAPVADKYSRRI